MQNKQAQRKTLFYARKLLLKAVSLAFVFIMIGAVLPDLLLWNNKQTNKSLCVLRWVVLFVVVVAIAGGYGGVICHRDTLRGHVHLCGLCCCLRPCWCLCYICSWCVCGRLCWYLWSVLPLETMSVIRAVKGDYVNVYGLWCRQKTCWCLWCILWPGVMLMSKICATGGPDDPWSLLPLETMLWSIFHGTARGWVGVRDSYWDYWFPGSKQLRETMVLAASGCY